MIPKRQAAMVFSLILVFSMADPSRSQNSFVPGDPLTDPRDGKTYNTVLIGDQCWMAENLNFGVQVDNFQQTDNGLPEKTCYDNDSLQCRILGGLYTWQEAMQGSDTPGARGICPPGWHLPTLEEWRALDIFLGHDSTGQKLKASPDDDPSWDGTNATGFNAVASGVGYRDRFGRKGHWAVFWTSTPHDSLRAWSAQLDGFWYPEPPKYPTLYLGSYFLKTNGFCVRCIRDRKGE